MSVNDPDLLLPWMLDEDRRGQPGARPRLDADNLFLLALREVFRDGEVSKTENQLLGQLARALGIDAEKSRRYALVVRKEYQEGRFAVRGEADMKTILLKACKFAAVDGVIDAGERRLLENFGRGVGITDDVLERILEAALVAPPQVPPPAAPAPAPAFGQAPAEPVSAPPEPLVLPGEPGSEHLSGATARLGKQPEPGATPAAPEAPAGKRSRFGIELDVEMPDLEIDVDMGERE